MSAPPPDVAAPRAALIAALAVGGPPPPDRVTARAPGVLRPVSAQLSAKLARRVQAGLAPTGGQPTRPRLTRLVRPSIGLAVLDAALLGVCVGQGRAALAVTAGALLAVFAGLALAVVLATTRDPLRLTPADRTALAAAAIWQSPSARLVGSPAHQLVALAAAGAERVAGSQAWLDTRIDLLPVDLCAVLDEVVESAAASGDGEAPTEAVDLVAMILAFADLLAEPLDQRTRERLDALAAQLRARTAQRVGEP